MGHLLPAGPGQVSEPGGEDTQPTKTERLLPRQVVREPGLCDAAAYSQGE